MPTDKQNASRRTPTSVAVERLYVYLFTMFAVLGLTIVLIVVYMHGALDRQDEILEHQTKTTEQLVNAVSTLTEAVRTMQATDRRQATKPAAAPQNEPTPVAPPATPTRTGPREEAVRDQLDQLLAPMPRSAADVRNAAVAGALVNVAAKAGADAGWSGDTWLRLAILARLVDRDVEADVFAGRARAHGTNLAPYLDVSARALLARGQPRAAEVLAKQLVERTDGAPAALVLHAVTLLATKQPAAADETSDRILAPDTLNVADRLTLARVRLSLEDWRGLAAALDGMSDVPNELAAEEDFVRAVDMVQAREPAQALAMLDFLAAHLPSSPGLVPGSPPSPSHYEIEVWRGVALMVANNTDAAREALNAAAQRSPGKADAHRYLGLLEARLGRPEEAQAHLKTALACDDGMAAAWEILGGVALNAGNAQQAIEYLQEAIARNGRRASSYFALALARAKLDEREATAAALEAAFSLEPAYLEDARQVDVFERLFTLEELAALAQPRNRDPV